MACVIDEDVFKFCVESEAADVVAEELAAVVDVDKAEAVIVLGSNIGADFILNVVNCVVPIYYVF